MNLFDELENKNKQTPLAEILRPTTLNEYLGQSTIVKENTAVWNLLKSGRMFSLILWGTPGCGKTTLARLIAKVAKSNFIELSAVNSGKKDILEAVASAKESLRSSGKKTIIFIDEIHRYSKVQQDALLPHIENGTIYLMGSTTENPSFQIIPALISRTQILMLKPIDDENMLKIVRKGYKYLIDKYGKIELEKEIGEFIVKQSRGDARIALNLVENSYFASDFKDGIRFLTVNIIEGLTQKKLVKYGVQEHYDTASAFQKSLRGSNPDGAIYYLAKMIAGGEDPRYIARRLIVTASEDVGLADNNALNVALSAFKAAETLGLPEARIPLAQATIYIAKAPKSNKAYLAIDKALHDIEQEGKDFAPPMHLRDTHYKDASKYGFGEGYEYSHSKPDSKQTYLPDELVAIDTKYYLED